MKPKQLIFYLVGAISAMFFYCAPATAQIRFTPDHISVGQVEEGVSVKKDYINFFNVNGMMWRHNNHYFGIDMTGTVPAICGTNGRVYFAQMMQFGVYFIPFTCSSVYSVWYNDFLTNSGNTALASLKHFSPVIAKSGDNGSNFILTKSVNLMEKESSSSGNLIADKVISADDEDTVIDYASLVPLLFKAISELQEVAESQEIQIQALEAILGK